MRRLCENRTGKKKYGFMIYSRKYKNTFHGNCLLGLCSTSQQLLPITPLSIQVTMRVFERRVLPPSVLKSKQGHQTSKENTKECMNNPEQRNERNHNRDNDKNYRRKLSCHSRLKLQTPKPRASWLVPQHQFHRISDLRIRCSDQRPLHGGWRWRRLLRTRWRRWRRRLFGQSNRTQGS